MNENRELQRDDAMPVLNFGGSRHRDLIKPARQRDGRPRVAEGVAIVRRFIHG